MSKLKKLERLINAMDTNNLFDSLTKGNMRKVDCDCCQDGIQMIELERWEDELEAYPSLLNGEDNPKVV